MTRNRSIDAVRAVACAFVLFVHCPFPGTFGVYVSALARFAVPFFLMVSGYYAHRDTDAAMLAAAHKQLRNTVKLTLAGTLFYAVSNTLRDALSGGHPLAWLSGLLSETGIRRFLVFNRAVFLSSIMYYLFMLLYVYALYMLLIRAKAMRFAYAAISILLLTGIVLNEFMLAPWYYTGNWLLTGLPFFLLGHYFAVRRLHISHPEWFILPGALLLCCETQLNAEIYVSFGALLLSVSIFLSCLAHPQGSMPLALVRFGRSGSAVLFIIHCAVRDYMKMLLPQSIPLYAWGMPLVVLILSVATSLALTRRKSVS